MNSLAKRSYKKEILDSDDIPFEDIRQNMRELNTINSLLGGHKITVDGVKKILNTYKITSSISICEIGCGGGDNLRAIEKYCKKNNIEVSFIAIDYKPECIEFARQQYPMLNCRWIISDYQKVVFTNNLPDIIFSSLFCHHFMEPQLIEMVQWQQKFSKKGFFINDLHRHPLAYYFIKFITHVYSGSYLVKNDAPLSVARGFLKIEWKKIFKDAGISKYTINWKWAFRHLIIYTHVTKHTI